ncbi:TRNA methyltransferase subunit [Spironucleus salmonicida]|uniref:tRNA (guanine(46)-N(7))-methyltransferase n=1 Tax=Spironucleus salmonicida TaxID=348837 RepID=V6M369_9EUKA|nr:TRNA methyltransferase subunit [Spironucleus salmonicida]KAH0572215.1 TRNA methyltransferase subunit [Spironucleus salmonicida]|eukprot:EST47709.1 tRNA methyltransferase subunit [Spironucleus salmonicida]
MEGFKNRPDCQSKAYQRFRHRPHSNPLADNNIPLPAVNADEFPYNDFYPEQNFSSFSLIDIGCGYGDFICKMASEYSQKSFLGLEIRDKAAAIAQQQIIDKRETESCLLNAAVLRCNVMRQLPILVSKGSVEAFSIMFADPQFKQQNKRRRVLTQSFAIELQYYLQSKGLILCCTDVQELSEAMDEGVKESGLFEKIDTQDGLCASFLKHLNQTADAQRHLRKDDDKTIYVSVWKKLI